MKLKKTPLGRIAEALKYIFLILMTIFAAFPLVQVLFNSFRTEESVRSSPIGLPDMMSFQNYVETWEIGGYARAYVNSFFVSLTVICIVLTIVGLAAYALTKLQFKFRDAFVAYFFVAMSLPGFLYIVSDYFMMNRLGLTNSHFGLILVYTATQIPMNMLLLRTFLAGIPRELEEAGKIDGCNELTCFLYITLPIAKPIFLTVALLIFVSTWNEFLWSNTFLIDDAMKLVATRYVKFVGEHSSSMARIYTASCITIGPVIVMYLIFNRRFIEGMTSGSVKG